MTRTARSTGLLAAAGLFAMTLPTDAQRAPAAAATHIPRDVLTLACAPGIIYEPPVISLRLTGGQDGFVRRTYGPGDLVTINGGTENGIEVGQEYFVRRVQVVRSQPITKATPAGVGTAGWIRVYAVDKRLSLATIVYACDTIYVDDYLEPFVLPTVATPAADAGEAQRSNYGRILFGAERRQTFAKGDFFIVDRGSDHGVTVGSRFVVYRDKQQAENFLFDLGEAVAVDVQPESSTLQVTVSRDVLRAGDYVAIRK